MGKGFFDCLATALHNLGIQDFSAEHWLEFGQMVLQQMLELLGLKVLWKKKFLGGTGA